MAGKDRPGTGRAGPCLTALYQVAREQLEGCPAQDTLILIALFLLPQKGRFTLGVGGESALGLLAPCKEKTQAAASIWRPQQKWPTDRHVPLPNPSHHRGHPQAGKCFKSYRGERGCCRRGGELNLGFVGLWNHHLEYRHDR